MVNIISMSIMIILCNVMSANILAILARRRLTIVSLASLVGSSSNTNAIGLVQISILIGMESVFLLGSSVHLVIS
mgnify:CR=1 FL=1